MYRIGLAKLLGSAALNSTAMPVLAGGRCVDIVATFTSFMQKKICGVASSKMISNLTGSVVGVTPVSTVVIAEPSQDIAW